MEELKSESAADDATLTRPRRPQPDWYHYVVPMLGTWFIVLIPMILLQHVELSAGMRTVMTILPIPFIVMAGWWAIFRADRFADEFELSTTRQMESIGYRFLCFWILAGELIQASGREWGIFESFQGLIWSFMLGLFLTNRRVYGRWIPQE